MNNIPVNKVTWFQLPAEDMERAWNFYHQVFGWSPEEMYVNKTLLGAINGEIAERNEGMQHPRLVIRVDNVNHMMGKIRKSGGEIVKERTEIPEIGMVFASFVDSEGNIINIVGDL
ncbi:VOC family protein [Shimazuella kribbensis]|uniref:VOC family protein n=1 Tax=Shimazuella kribbensis TaxID=139808 RepID=UPI00040506AD|nr:VOC family protein [Shimazuella kribbensis]